MSTFEIATLGGGCFWCLEAVFVEVRGIRRVVSGYAGGAVAHPTYDQVCSGATGHAEVVQLTFDPAVITYRDLLDIFFTVHDPTTLNRQGADVGTQYRSVICYHTPEQQQIAQQLIRELAEAHRWPAPIVTALTAYTEFYPAEAYHQNYYRNNAAQPYCRAVIAPKLAKFRQHFQPQLQSVL